MQKSKGRNANNETQADVQVQNAIIQHCAQLEQMQLSSQIREGVERIMCDTVSYSFFERNLKILLGRGSVMTDGKNSHRRYGLTNNLHVETKGRAININGPIDSKRKALQAMDAIHSIYGPEILAYLEKTEH